MIPSLSDLFTANPGPVASSFKFVFLLAFALAMLATGALAPNIKKLLPGKAAQKTLARSRVGGVCFGISLLLLALMRLEQVPVLSARILVYSVFLGALAYIGWRVWSWHQLQQRISRGEARRAAAA